MEAIADINYMREFNPALISVIQIDKVKLVLDKF